MNRVNLSRRIKAFCAECQGFEGKVIECDAIACPLYGLLGQDETKAIPWYLHPRTAWEKVSHIALLEKRMEPLPEPTPEQIERGKALAARTHGR